MTVIATANEVNGLGEFASDYHKVDRTIHVGWDSPKLAKITRLRLLTEPGFPAYDVSYCHGELKDGTPCRVEVPFGQIPRSVRGSKCISLNAFIIKEAKADGVYAKGLGIFDAISILF